MTRTTIRLPWPGQALSPNTRQHWARHSRAKSNYRLACLCAVREQGVASLPGNRWDVSLVFNPPNRRRLDLDNLLARMKAGLDGVAQALGIDDAQFVRISGEMAAADPMGADAACVLVTIEPHAVEVAK